MKKIGANWIDGFFVTAFVSTGLSYGSIYLFHIFFLLSLLWLVSSMQNGLMIQALDRAKKHSVFLFFMLFFYSASISWSKTPDYAALYLVYVVIGITIVIFTEAYVNSQVRYRRTFKIITIAFLAELTISSVESLGVLRWPLSPYSEFSTYFGKDPIDWGSREYMQELSATIPTGFRGNPNQLALIIVVSFPFLILSKSIWIRYCLTLLSLFVVYSSSSRGALIALFFQVFVASFISRRIRVYITFSLVVAVAALLINDRLTLVDLSVFGLLTEAFDAVLMYVTLTAGDEGSISHRLSLMYDAWNAFAPTYGVGLGAGGSFMLQTWIPSGSGLPASLHNFWFELLVDGGLFIFFGFLILTVKLAASLIMEGKKNSDLYYRYHCTALGISIIGFMIGCISASSVIYHLPMWIMYGMGFALIKIASRERKLTRIVYT